MWWFDDRIERTVTRQFVCSHLLPDEIDRLDRPLAFGDGLTDGTYWDWIDQKAKKIFLILVDLHVPDQIFGIIDDSWDDEDLPIAHDHVERLALTPQKDERFERKFYQRQFFYLLRPLERNGLPVVYDDMAVVPVDVVDLRRVGSSGGSGNNGGSISTSSNGSYLGSESTGSGVVTGMMSSSSPPSSSLSSSSPSSPSSLSSSTSMAASSASSASSTYSSATPFAPTVRLPNYPGIVLSRRRVPLALHDSSSNTAATSGRPLTLDEFQDEIRRARCLQNDHLVSYFASYVHQGVGYVLFTPTNDGSIKTLLATTPAPYKALTKRDRRRYVFNWIHCLVDTLCFVHNRGLSHGNIKPSTVLLRTSDLHVFFSDSTQLFGSDGSGGGGSGFGSSSAADKTFDKESYDYAAPEQWYRPPGGGAGAGASPGNGGGGCSGRGVVYGASGGGGGSLPATSDSVTSTSFSISRMASGGSSSSAWAYGEHHGTIPQLNPQAADVFSIGCIILELLSWMLKRQTRAFATHRAAKHKTPGRGGAVLDASFHKNLGQVESWMSGLAKEAVAMLQKKRGIFGCGSSGDEPDPTLAGVAPMLHVVERMLALHASERPSIFDVQTRMYQILRDHCGIAEPHCVHQYPAATAAYAGLPHRSSWSDYAAIYAGTGGGAGYASSRCSSDAVSPTTGHGWGWAGGWAGGSPPSSHGSKICYSPTSPSFSTYYSESRVPKTRSILSTPHYRPHYHHPRPAPLPQ